MDSVVIRKPPPFRVLITYTLPSFIFHIMLSY